MRKMGKRAAFAVVLAAVAVAVTIGAVATTGVAQAQVPPGSVCRSAPRDPITGFC
jgi:hypothetical protein